MIRNLISLNIAAAVLFGGAVYAQETTDTETAPAEGTAPSVGGNLDLGQPVDESTQVGQRYAKEAFGDWNLTCLKTNLESDPCSLLQQVNGPQDVPMAEFSLFPLPEGQAAVAGANVIVPLETLLTEQLTISIDGAPAKRYAFSFCDPVGCVAQIGLTQADIDAMQKGSKATLRIVPAPAPDQVLRLEVSLAGFTAGFEAVSALEN